MKRLILAGVVCMVIGVSLAADFTWLGSPASANWNEVDANWTGAGSVWVNGAANNVFFGASDTQNITVDPAVTTVSNVTFSADGYALGGGSLTLNGNLTVGADQTAVITTPMAHPWTNIISSKLGAGALVLNPTGGGNSNRWGSLKVAAGTLQITGGTNIVTLAGSNPESGPAFWVSGGTLVIGGGLLKTTGGAFARVSEYGTLLITNGLCDLSGNSELLNAHNSPGNTTVSGSGILDVQGLRVSQNTNPSLAALNVVNVNTGGTIRLVSYTIDAASKKYGKVNFNGGTSVAKADGVDFFNTGHSNWVGMAAYVLEGGAIFDSNGKGITIKQALQSGVVNDGGLTKKNTGNLNLLGDNTYCGGTFLWAGSISITNDANLGAVPASPQTNFTFVGNSTLRSSANHTLAMNRTMLISNGVTATFDTQGYTQTVHSLICGEGTGSLTKLGSGTLELDVGADRTNTVSTLVAQAGTVHHASGMLNITTNAGNTLFQGFYAWGGTVLVGGGTLSAMQNRYSITRNGALIVTNGTVLLKDELLNAYSGVGNTTVSGSGVLDLQTLRVSQNGGSPDSNTVNVNTGGTIRLQRFYIDALTQSKSRINLNGGTLVAKSTRSDFMGIAHTNWYNGIFFTVREGGAVIDSNGYAIDSKMPLYNGAASDGGLIKKGAGTFTLNNTNTYNGVTSVEEGSLVLGLNDTLPPMNTVRVSSNAIFNVNNKTQSLAGIGGSGTLTNIGSLTVTDRIAPGDADAFGTLTLASACSLSGELDVDVAADGSCDRLHVQGDLDLSALALNVSDTGLLNKDKRYVLATCTGTLSGVFTSANVPLRWLIRYDTANSRAYLIYNSGTLITVF